MTVDVEKLRELAQAAAPGPWLYDSTGGVCGQRYASCVWTEKGPGRGAVAYTSPYSIHGPQDLTNAAYIAAANPATVLALLDENARLREALDRIQELATDTPEPECYEPALNAIVKQCEDALSGGAASPLVSARHVDDINDPILTALAREEDAPPDQRPLHDAMEAAALAASPPAQREPEPCPKPCERARFNPVNACEECPLAQEDKQ